MKLVHHKDTKDTKVRYREKTIGFGTMSFVRRAPVGPDKPLASNLGVLCVFVVKSLSVFVVKLSRWQSERLALVRAVTRSR
jgi:hypothetical protein